MVATRQKPVARRKASKARPTRRARAHSTRVPRTTKGMSTAEQNRLPASQFAFPRERKEPLIDAAHVRNAIARFDQVKGVSNAERDRAWRRIRAAARKFNVEISVRGWRQLGSKDQTKAKAR